MVKTKNFNKGQHMTCLAGALEPQVRLVLADHRRGRLPRPEDLSLPRQAPGRVDLPERAACLSRLTAGRRFNRKQIWLGFKKELRFHFDSETCLNYPNLNIFLVLGISSQNSSDLSSQNSSQNFSIELGSRVPIQCPTLDGRVWYGV